MRRVFLIVAIQAISVCFGFAQSKRGNVAVFGFFNAVSLDFNFDPPVVKIFPKLSVVNFSSDECVASISDTEGNLLFYTNGLGVYNRKYKPMPNNEGLMGNDGNGTTTQMVIVPWPKDPFRYYIFTPKYAGRDFVYSLIDMRLDNGDGGVVFENKFLFSSTTEKVCVVKHSSGEALWLITHSYGSNEFNVYLIDENGINVTPVKSAVGVSHSGDRSSCAGYMKPSHDGNRIVCAVGGQLDVLEIFDFNKTTGEVSNPVRLSDTSTPGKYGVEFSPDNSRLYLSCVDRGSGGRLYQFDLLAGTTEQIANSVTLISTRNNTAASLQLAPDGKIYHIGVIGAKYLDVIENPNGLGLQCNLSRDKIDLFGEYVRLGLPDMIYNTVEPEIFYKNYCEGQEISFELIKIKDYASISWDFGDADSGDENFSDARSPVHTYKRPGDYRAAIKVTFSDGSVFNYTQPISIVANPYVDLGKDTTKCAGTYINLAPKSINNVTYYRWNDGYDLANRNVITPGKYWVNIASQFSCVSSDTIEVIDLKAPISPLKDTTLCSGEILHIRLDSTNTYLWKDGVADNERFIQHGGNYSVIAQNRCGQTETSMDVDFIPPVNLDLNDTLLCANTTLLLNVTNQGSSYHWQDGAVDSVYTIDKGGDYWVQVSNRCESLTDSLHVSYVDERPYLIPNVITSNDDGVNDTFHVDEFVIDPSVKLFNRWGKLVYSSQHYKNDWSATDVPSGIYFYVIHNKCKTEIKGIVHVLK